MTEDPFSPAVDPILLRDMLVNYFSIDDLQDLCFEMSVDFDNLPGDTKAAKARELIIFCRNRAKLGSLIEKAKLARPSLNWISESKNGGNSYAPKPTPEQQIYALVMAFNKNRHRAISSQRTQVASEIAFQMRELAPSLDGQLDAARWLNSDSIGKRVAAVVFLDWKQDIEFLVPLLDQLLIERPFVQFQILLALNSMLDQLSYEKMKYLQKRLADYNPEGDSSRTMLSFGIQQRIEYWFAAVS